MGDTGQGRGNSGGMRTAGRGQVAAAAAAEAAAAAQAAAEEAAYQAAEEARLAAEAAREAVVGPRRQLVDALMFSHEIFDQSVDGKRYNELRRKWQENGDKAALRKLQAAAKVTRDPAYADMDAHVALRLYAHERATYNLDIEHGTLVGKSPKRSAVYDRTATNNDKASTRIPSEPSLKSYATVRSHNHPARVNGWGNHAPSFSGQDITNFMHSNSRETRAVGVAPNGQMVVYRMQRNGPKPKSLPAVPTGAAVTAKVKAGREAAQRADWRTSPQTAYHLGVAAAWQCQPTMLNSGWP